MTINLLQFTDLHLLTGAESELRGVPTGQSLDDVLRFARAWAEERWKGRIDRIVITGDMAHDEQLSSYQRLREMLGDWLPLTLILPGNHDDRGFIRQAFGDEVSADGLSICFSTDAGEWRLLGVDSHQPGKVEGLVAIEQMNWLNSELKAHDDRPTIVFVHHPPFEIGSAWLDRIGLANAESFRECLGRNTQVRAVSAGHVHQQFESRLASIELLTSPSTAIQFVPGDDVFSCQAIPPGFRFFELNESGFRSDVVRLPELRFPPIESEAV